METLVGTIAGDPYWHQMGHNGNKYIICPFTTDSGDRVTIKGEMNTYAFGWDYRLHGEWKEDAKGRAFAFDSFDPMIPKSARGTADYLARHLPTVGTKWADKITEHFGDDALSILKESPDRLREVPGLTHRMLVAIKEFLASGEFEELDPVVHASLYDLLSPIRPPRKVFKVLLKEFGSNAPQFVREHPYRLQDLPGIGWDRVDRLALDHLKYDKRGLERHEQGAIEAISRQAEQGHTKVDHYTLYHDAAALLGMVLDPEAVESLVGRRQIIRTESGGQTYYSRLDLYVAEQTIARRIAELQAAAPAIDIDNDFAGLESDQAKIIECILGNGVCILAGVPGSGKSYATGVTIRGLYRQGIERILVVAPTGKAAKRDSEFLADFMPEVKIPCMTIHRALGVMESDEEEGISKEHSKINRGRDPWKFAHGEDNKLPYDIFIIDEASMGDVRLMASFLVAIPDGARLIIVGDPNQLPSVGPGAVLRDLVACPFAMPAVILDKPRRNSGAIAEACWKIKNGITPRAVPGTNWIQPEISNDIDIFNFILQLHTNYVAKYGAQRCKDDLQVISPQYKELLGCNSLNSALSQIVNPPTGDFNPSIEWGKDENKTSLRIGDKVVRTKNGQETVLLDPEIPMADLAAIYGSEEANALELEGWRFDFDPVYVNGKEYAAHKCYLVNGDIGEVVGIQGKGPFAKMFVRFKSPDRLCALTVSESHISPAYALTVHKMQGSSAPWVIVPLAKFHWNPRSKTGLQVRELVYTAFSRPTFRLITPGRWSELNAAVGRVTIDHRQTLLKELMAQQMEGSLTAAG